MNALGRPVNPSQLPLPALVGDHSSAVPAHQAIPRAPELAGAATGCEVSWRWFPAGEIQKAAGDLADCGNLWVVPGTDQQRAPGVPCIKDRGIQRAAVLVRVPIFEADLSAERGYTIGRCCSPKDGRAFIGTRASGKPISVLCQSISQMTRPAFHWKAAEEMVEDLNRTLSRWGNYFCLDAVSRTSRAVDNRARHRLRRSWNGKLRSRGLNAMRHAPLNLRPDSGWLRLAPTTAHRSRANACNLLNGSRMPEIGPSGLNRLSDKSMPLP